MCTKWKTPWTSEILWTGVTGLHKHTHSKAALALCCGDICWKIILTVGTLYIQNVWDIYCNLPETPLSSGAFCRTLWISEVSTEHTTNSALEQLHQIVVVYTDVELVYRTVLAVRETVVNIYCQLLET